MDAFGIICKQIGVPVHAILVTELSIVSYILLTIAVGVQHLTHAASYWKNPPSEKREDSGWKVLVWTVGWAPSFSVAKRRMLILSLIVMFDATWEMVFAETKKGEKKILCIQHIFRLITLDLCWDFQRWTIFVTASFLYTTVPGSLHAISSFYSRFQFGFFLLFYAPV